MPKSKDKEGAVLIDWYKKIPEKFLLKSHNPHYERHHIKLPFRMIIGGSSGSGKTQTLLSLIYNMPDTFENIFLVTKNKDEPLYNYLDDKFKKSGGVKITEIDKDGLPDLDKLNKEEQNLIIMDDLVGEKNQKPMEQYFLRARKKNASLVYITQSYYAVPKMIRNNITHLIIKQVSSMKNLTMIAREYDLGLTKKKLVEMYHDATADKQNFLLLDLDGEPTKRFRKGFNDYYDLSSEKEEG